MIVPDQAGAASSDEADVAVLISGAAPLEEREELGIWFPLSFCSRTQEDSDCAQSDSTNFAQTAPHRLSFGCEGNEVGKEWAGKGPAAAGMDSLMGGVESRRSLRAKRFRELLSVWPTDARAAWRCGARS